MKKTFFSILGGLILGLFVSFILFDYRSTTITYVNKIGADKVIREMDFNFVFNTSIMVIGISILIFVIWSFVDKKKDEKFLKEFESSRRQSR
ncbi:hypothetical protein [Planococcus sp. CAU13]|uniref:hypothetical protein n=1 Tax=Planococcus sp. CAU13 TaxID=1541197 RepID=UPI00052FEAE1|nr:hypothetical protein [Planococcus sp. CAU13]